MNKRWRKISLFVFLPIVIIGGLFYWLTWSGSTDDIERVANQFKPNSSWTLANNYSVPPKTLCIGEICPRLVRTWTLSKPITQAEIVGTLNNSGWSQVSLGAGCESDNNSSGSDVCRMQGIVEDYKVTISALTKSPSERAPTVSLYMYKR